MSIRPTDQPARGEFPLAVAAALTGLTQRGATEEPPAALAAGPCRGSPLVLAEPFDSEPVAVRDGTDATWVVPTS